VAPAQHAERCENPPQLSHSRCPAPHRDLKNVWWSARGRSAAMGASMNCAHCHKRVRLPSGKRAACRPPGLSPSSSRQRGRGSHASARSKPARRNAWAPRLTSTRRGSGCGSERAAAVPTPGKAAARGCPEAENDAGLLNGAWQSAGGGAAAVQGARGGPAARDADEEMVAASDDEAMPDAVQLTAAA
jgi:hypothetical protein